MICKVHLSTWEFHPRYHPERIEPFIKMCRDQGEDPPEPPIKGSPDFEDSAHPWCKFVSHGTHQLDILVLAKLSWPFSVKEGIAHDEALFAVKMVNLLQSINKRLDTFKVSGSQNITFNISGDEDSVLHQMDDACVLEDCCTDQLRDHLKDNWRIISAFIESGNRRPTYILGKVRPIMIIHELPQSKPNYEAPDFPMNINCTSVAVPIEGNQTTNEIHF
jgi:hypothetical protein